jgi:hypothetical protein
MRACNSWGKASRPGLELQRQNQRVNVSGFTMLKALSKNNFTVWRWMFGQQQGRSRRRIATLCNWRDNAAAGQTDPLDGKILCRKSPKAECQSNQRERHTIASRIALAACCGLT